MKYLLFFLFIYLTISTFGMAKKLEKVTLGGGCFWCTEAIYLELKGVVGVKPGYSGGYVKNPTYKEVCTENTGHAEVVQITFDPDLVSFSEILEVFFMTHNPTTLNRQGNDVGTQYRSVVFYHSEKQKQTAERVIQLFGEEGVYENPIVTEVTKFDKFYPAEDYHINYFAKNKNQGYCQFVVAPKVEKFKKIFKEKLKE
ncbi:MAG: peptide-methionine (S)-S-oxide reductase MsrA [Draconibacterium sp.]|nr:peptide-methionine (S)-S-oxide reductase MsrA [Draconibacterium sp.]